jgi:hypothetical protein
MDASHQDTTKPRLRAATYARLSETYDAAEALGIGIAYSSERVIEKVRRFRRGYTGPGTFHVRNFDERLRSTLL